METLTPQQKLQLADDIEQLIASHYPLDHYSGQEDALAIALMAVTNLAFVRRLFAGD